MRAPRDSRPIPGGWDPSLLKSRIYEELLLDIICGRLRPGGRLEEAVLVREYRCALGGVRDALGRLALEGLVTRHVRVGTTVAPLDLLEIEQVFEARILVEGYCAAAAAEKATAEDIEVIRHAFDGVEAVIGARDYRTLIRMDQAFHRGMARASQNAALERVVVSLHNNSSRFWHHSLSRRSVEALEIEIQLHRDVAEAIAKGDGETAERAMRGVLGLFPDSMRSVLAGNMSGAAGRRHTMARAPDAEVSAP